MVTEYQNIDAINQKSELMNVFFSANYKTAEEVEGCNVIYLKSDTYILPVRISKKKIFKYASFPTEPFRYSNNSEKLRDFLNDSCKYLSENRGIQWINENDSSSLFGDYPKDSSFIPFGSHVIDLALDEEQLWKNVHSKHRNVIKKAEKEGVIIEKGLSEKLLSDYHKMDVETWTRSNKNAKGESLLSRFVKNMGDKAIVYVAYKDGEPQSGAIFYYNKQMCYYMLGANKNNPLTGSGNLLQWTAILDMKSVGVKKYSFVGCRINEDENSKYHGIQRFKERFGGQLIQGYMFKVVFNRYMYFLFNLLLFIRVFIATKKIAWPKGIIEQEIHKWK